MPLLKKKTMLFDLIHNEMLDIYDDEYSEFLSLLQRLSVTIRKTESDDLIKEILNNNIDILIIGNPINNYFSTIEIKHIVDFVREGGHLILISEYGADFLQKTNLNDLAFAFGIYFEKDIVKERNRINLNCSSVLSVQNFQKHKITNNLREVVIGGACSIMLYSNSNPLLLSNGATWIEIYKGTSDQTYKVKETSMQIVAACTEYGQGKVIALGDVDLFSNQFLNQMDNRKFIINMLNWLIEPVKDSDVMFWILSQVGALHDEIRVMNKKINNIIETLTFFEERISSMEDHSPNSMKLKSLKKPNDKSI